MTEKGNTGRKRIFEGRRYRIMMLCACVAVVVASAATFAWYSAQERYADSAPADVMKPYYLTLRNPSDTAALELSVGNLFPGDTKQVVFCVSNKNNEKTGLDMGVTSFSYSIELIHTENLALNYRIYGLDAATQDTAGAFAVLDEVETESGSTQSHTTYWVKKASGGVITPLTGEDVSESRHTLTGLTDPLPINAGTYVAYKKGADGTELTLQANVDANGDPTFDSQFFLIEIDWKDGADTEFEKYEKETDMIYLLVEALQPRPEKNLNQAAKDQKSYENDQGRN